jgi:hypothetical protein
MGLHVNLVTVNTSKKHEVPGTGWYIFFPVSPRIYHHNLQHIAVQPSCFTDFHGLGSADSYLNIISIIPSPESASKLYRPSDLHLCLKLVPTFADRGCHVVSVTDSYGCILGFLNRSRYFFFQVASQLYSRGWVDPVPNPLNLRKVGSARNRARTSYL